MIFVTVGTHEQPFDRLIRCVDELKKKGNITEEVIIQTGFATYEPKYCEWSKLFPYGEMIRKVEAARIVITHGGPASFIMPLQIGKIPIVVPRQKKYNEHVNDHQVEFARAVAGRMGTIIVVEDVSRLGDVIGGYEERCLEIRNNRLQSRKAETSESRNMEGRNAESRNMEGRNAESGNTKSQKADRACSLIERADQIDSPAESLAEPGRMGNNIVFNKKFEEIVRELGVE